MCKQTVLAATRIFNPEVITSRKQSTSLNWQVLNYLVHVINLTTVVTWKWNGLESHTRPQLHKVNILVHTTHTWVGWIRHPYPEAMLTKSV